MDIRVVKFSQGIEHNNGHGFDESSGRCGSELMDEMRRGDEVDEVEMKLQKEDTSTITCDHPLITIDDTQLISQPFSY
jgi:hypothetical protein